MAYRYGGCGLDAVYLENGFSAHDTAYGAGVSIKDTDKLHRTIAEWLIFSPQGLNGAELRFLRLEMDRAPREFAEFLGVTEKLLRAWERGRAKELPGPADRLVRALCAEDFGLELSLRRFAEGLATARVSGRVRAHFRRAENEWKVEPQA